MMNSDTKLNKKIRDKVFYRWMLLGEAGWNYEKMQGSGYCYSMMPALKEIYKDDEEALQGAVKNHLQFFNCSPLATNLILGVNLAVEETLKEKGTEAVAGIKTGLMGPMAGIGDSIFGVIIPTVLGSIASYMALEGNALGTWIWLGWAIPYTIIKYLLFKLGYNQGANVVKNISGALKNITESANILGLTVVGALIPTVVKADVPLVFTQGDVSFEVQPLIDSILPSLLPVLVVAFVYWILGMKKMNSTKAIILLIIIGVALSALGILG